MVWCEGVVSVSDGPTVVLDAVVAGALTLTTGVSVPLVHHHTLVEHDDVDRVRHTLDFIVNGALVILRGNGHVVIHLLADVEGEVHDDVIEEAFHDNLLVKLLMDRGA